MVKIKLWDKKTPLIYANGELASPAKVLEDYPFTRYAPTVLEYNAEMDAGIMIGGIDNLYVLRQIHAIDETLTDEQAVEAILEIRNTPLPEPEPRAEERIAAALEFQTLMSLSDTM